MTGGSSTTTRSRTDPWKPARPYLEQILNQSQALYNQGVQTPDFNTVVPASQQTQDAWSAITRAYAARQ